MLQSSLHHLFHPTHPNRFNQSLPFADCHQLHSALVYLGFHPNSLESENDAWLHTNPPTSQAAPHVFCIGEPMIAVLPLGYHWVTRPNSWASLTRLGDVRFPRPAGIVRELWLGHLWYPKGDSVMAPLVSMPPSPPRILPELNERLPVSTQQLQQTTFSFPHPRSQY